MRTPDTIAIRTAIQQRLRVCDSEVPGFSETSDAQLGAALAQLETALQIIADLSHPDAEIRRTARESGKRLIARLTPSKEDA